MSTLANIDFRVSSGGVTGPLQGHFAWRARQIRDEAGLHLLRGAAISAGGAVVTYGPALAAEPPADISCRLGCQG